MADVTWPSTLPCGLFQGYSYQRVDTAVRTELETGRIRMRRRYSDAPARAQISWMMDSCQFSFFEYWWKNRIDAGTLPFNMDLNVGAGIATHELRFLSTYIMRGMASNDAYQVSAEFEIRKLALIDDATFEILEEYSAEGFDACEYYGFLDIFEIFVNIDLPASEMGA